MMYDYIIEKPELNEDTLAHYGIKGMKWKNHVRKVLINGRGRLRQLLGNNDSGNYSNPEARGEDAKFQQKNKFGNRGYTKSRSVKARLSASYANIEAGTEAGRKRAGIIVRPRSRKKTVRAGVGNIRKRIIN